MSLANQDCVRHPLHPTPLHTHTRTKTHTRSHCPLNRRVNENAFAFQCTATTQVPTHSTNANIAGEKAPFTRFVSKLVTDLLLPPTPVSFSCFLITNPLARGGCAWVNRAVGACHVCSSGERSSQRWGMRWFVVIDSYLETGLMELSKLYANSLFPYHCRCTLLRCTAHTHTHTHSRAHTAFSSIRHIMGTQIFIRTMVFSCNTRRGCQISNRILLSGVILV